MYQPFRPPTSPNPVALPGASSTEEQLEILRERRGFWHAYATIIPVLTRAGYSPSMVDEATGMTGVEQNIVVVASQVRSSLIASGCDEETLAHFDVGGAELLYELRILSAQQRKASAEFAMERRMDPKGFNELARAVKDFERRKAAEGFKEFTSAPGDCLAFACYRQSKEYGSEVDEEAILKKALSFCVSEKARAKIENALNKSPSKDASKEAETQQKFMQVIRLLEGEAADAKLPIMLPVIDANLKEFEAVPLLPARGTGPFNVFQSDTDWKKWVALPGWDAIVAAGAPIAVSFPDPSILPLQSNKNGVAKLMEPTLVVVDKALTEEDGSDSLYLVLSDGSEELNIKARVPESGERTLGRVVIALRPPIIESQDPIDWE